MIKEREKKNTVEQNSMKTYRRIWECIFFEPIQTRSMCTSVHSARNQRFQINSIRLYCIETEIDCTTSLLKKESFADFFLNLIPFLSTNSKKCMFRDERFFVGSVAKISFWRNEHKYRRQHKKWMIMEKMKRLHPWIRIKFIAAKPWKDIFSCQPFKFSNKKWFDNHKVLLKLN